MKKWMYGLGLFLVALTVTFLFSFRTSQPTSMTYYNGDDYEKEWQEIDSLDQNGLPKSANEKVEALFERAVKDKNQPQIVKTILYRSKYAAQLKENGFVEGLLLLEEETAKHGFPVQPILQSIQANMYTEYIDNNYWKLSNRSETIDFKSSDVNTWTTGQLIDRANNLYLASIEAEALKTVGIKGFDAILLDNDPDFKLRPTLYDFLMHRALDHFMNERTYLSKPAYQFYLDQESYFAPAAEFAGQTIETKDTASLKYQAMLLFQDLLSFHLNDENPNPLIDADLKRLRFVQNQTVLSDKFDYYLKALDQILEKYPKQALYPEVLYAKALLYNEEGRKYNADDPNDQRADYLKKTVGFCQEIVDQFPDSKAANKAKNLISQLEEKRMRVQLEKVNIPGKPSLGITFYNNIDQLYFRVIRLDKKRDDKIQKLRNDRSKLWDYLKKLNPVESWNVQLPSDGDYREHSTEFRIPSLPGGHFMLLASDDDKWEEESNAGYQSFYVSNLSYWNRPMEENKLEYVVFDRSTGEPKEGVKGEFYSQRYQSLARRYEWVKIGAANSDENGFIRGTHREKRGTIRLGLIDGSDSLFLDNAYAGQFREWKRRSTRVIHFFTDRALYRPGQTIYFKAVLLTKDEDGMPEISPNETVEVTLTDANHQQVASLNLRSNEYGTISGSFTAPSSGLLGQMALKSDFGGERRPIRVEEYKRPKFEVSFEPVDEAYSLNEEVEVTGKAVGFAGNNIDGAQVQYRVIRQTRFPWLPWWRRRWIPVRDSNVEIANGQTTTNADGTFSISFSALPDQMVSPETNPEFHYKVIADVTDITGETQSSSASVTVGYIALRVSFDLPDEVLRDSFQFVKVNSENLSGEFEACEGTLKLEALKAPERVFVDRMWGEPDRYSMNKEEYRRWFPNIPYKQENQTENFEVKRQVWELAVNTAEEKKVPVGKVKLNPGPYKLTLKTKDKNGREVSLERIFTLYQKNGKAIPNNDLVWWVPDVKLVEPGEEADLLIGAFDRQKVLFEIEKDQEIVESKWLDISEVRTLKIPVQEKDRGGFSYYLNYAGLNRSWNLRQTVSVPWSNKELTIEYATFRDKLLPGQEEEWILKITGPKKEKIAAEVVAGMYDQSLDQFVGHGWAFTPFPYGVTTRRRLTTNAYQSVSLQGVFYRQRPYYPVEDFRYPKLDYPGYAYSQFLRSYESVVLEDQMVTSQRLELKGAKNGAPPPPPAPSVREEVSAEADQEAGSGEVSEPSIIQDSTSPMEEPTIPVRTNLDETVFFYPHLETDEEGNVLIKFTMNEALTKWKFMAFAHTKDLKSAVTTKSIVTQKDLMVMPNPPRFYRERDEIELTAKVVNLSDGPLSGTANLDLINPLNGMAIFPDRPKADFERAFEVKAGQSARLAWTFKVPDISKVPVIQHTVIAKAGEFSDGEQEAKPVLSNRMLVTETMPLPIGGKETKTFTFKAMQENESSTLSPHRYTLEFTSNPAWYAVQALPYLMEYPYDCTEQIFSRYYANTLATTVANSYPKIKTVFEQWKGTDALESNLAKNQELKSALLEETPWVLAAQNEKAQKQNIALLFDLNKMSREQTLALKKLRDRQLPNGGFAWFPGGRDNWYISQYIMEGMGHLQNLGAVDYSSDQLSWLMVKNAVGYIDQRVAEHYREIEKAVKRGDTKWEDDHLSPIIIHYLYTRSFFLENLSPQAQIRGEAISTVGLVEMSNAHKKIYDYFVGQAEQHWFPKGIYQEGMLSLALFRSGRYVKAEEILASLKERSLEHEELGMYWKSPRGFYWYQYPIATQALLIEAFQEVGSDIKSVEKMKTWLLKNKQTTHWKTTKATASAVYAFLMNGANWLVEDQPLEISLGAKKGKINTNWEKKLKQAQSTAEAGTGYFKVAFDEASIDKEMATIKLKNPNSSIAWGGAYWQYFEDLDKIQTFEETPLTIKKQLFRVTLTDTGEALKTVKEGDVLQVGEKLKVRIELRVDRDMEYVHMKDMRASGFEPINVLSSYKWQGGLGYYESTRDASTNFFFGSLPKGTFVFEYPLRVVHQGDFSNGITTIQCMYAPEFTSHSEGVRVKVKE
jgi:uncharacterized protein YfaS (alpha-2-macroglobulin family)